MNGNCDKNIIGAVVKSIAGRDSKRLFVVVGAEQPNYVYLADGQTHKLAAPKKKKLKHIKLTGTILQELALELAQNSKLLLDSDIRKSLCKFNENSVSASEEE